MLIYWNYILKKYLNYIYSIFNNFQDKDNHLTINWFLFLKRISFIKDETLLSNTFNFYKDLLNFDSIQFNLSDFFNSPFLCYYVIEIII